MWPESAPAGMKIARKGYSAEDGARSRGRLKRPAVPVRKKLVVRGASKYLHGVRQKSGDRIERLHGAPRASW
jgi:hypothetical protein